MSVESVPVTFRTLDGLDLAATLVTPGELSEHDIRVALAYVQEASGAARVSLLGASFTGGVCACYAARRPAEVDRLVLLNPQLDYKQRTIGTLFRRFLVRRV